MRYLLFILLLISHLSSAQRWRAGIGWLQTNSTIQRADLPTLYDRDKTAALPGGQVGLGRDLGRYWFLAARFSVSGMDYRVRRPIAETIELTGSYRPIYANVGTELRLGRIVWQNQSQRWQLLASAGPSVHRAFQNGHE